MHRDEAIYARADAHASVLLTDEERDAIVAALRYVGDPERLDYRGRNFEWLDIQRDHARALAARLEAASTTPSP